MDLGLSFKNRLHLAVHNVVALTGIDGLRPVRLEKKGDNFLLTTTGHSLIVPAALIWRSYRRGWNNRLSRLAIEFGLGSLFPIGVGDTVVDVGANVGDFSIAAAKLGAKVFAFDGDPLVVACNKLNTGEFDNIETHCQILWSKETELTFYSAPGRADSSIFLPSGDGVASFTAKATTLDLLAERYGIDEITLLKMDAEGAEPEVLEGAKKILEKTRYIAIDTGPERLGSRTDKECTRILTAYGFSVFPHTNPKRQVTFAKRS